MTSVHEWITDHSGDDWAVIVIGPNLKCTYISEYMTMHGHLQNKHSLSGIHKRDVLVVVDPEIEDWMPELVASLTASSGSKHIPFSTTEEDR